MSHQQAIDKILGAIRASDRVGLVDHFEHACGPKSKDLGFCGATITVQIPDVDIAGSAALIDIEVTNYYGEIYYDVNPCVWFERGYTPRMDDFRVMANGTSELLRYGPSHDLNMRVWESFSDEQLISDLVRYANKVSGIFQNTGKEVEDV